MFHKEDNKDEKDEWIDDYYLQCAAYALAHNTVHGSNISQGVILLCTKDNMFQRFLIEGERLKDYQNKFLEKVEQFYAKGRGVDIDEDKAIQFYEKETLLYSFSHFDLNTDIFYLKVKRKSFPKQKWLKISKFSNSQLPTVMKKIVEKSLMN